MDSTIDDINNSFTDLQQTISNNFTEKVVVYRIVRIWEVIKVDPVNLHHPLQWKTI